MKSTQFKNEVLIIPDKIDAEREELASIWIENGGEVMRVGKFWVTPETEGRRVTLYGYDTFCLVLAQLLHLDMVSPKDEMIVDLKFKFLKRSIFLASVSEITTLKFPIFIKPVTPKLFPAGVYANLELLSTQIVGLEEAETLICSEVLVIKKEVRAFILDNEIMDLAFYEGEGDLGGPRSFILDFLEESLLDLPNTFVIDVGYNDASGWFVIEFNSSWGAGLNFCHPDKVVVSIRAATIPYKE
ncbi:MAG: ATP-grasp domain-containing protein [Saprospiraceae bacterium]|nr:ATP-grasp domain-containing protein [Saprospiraceae bacterium]